jgi:hypothetical protein
MRALTLACSALVPLTALRAQDDRAPFEAPWVAFPESTSIVAMGDLDADGDPDAIGWYWETTAQSGVLLKTFTNDGSGRFAPRTTVSRPYVPGYGWDVRVGRFDHVPGDDFVSAFHREVEVSNGARWTEPWSVTRLGVLDFDHDGLDDVAVLGGALHLYRNTGTGFTKAAGHPIGGLDLMVAELDGDGSPDLLVAQAQSIDLLYVHGSQIVAGPSHPLGLQPIEDPMFASGDIDGDRDDDVVVFIDTAGGRIGSAEYIVYRRTGPAAFVAEPRVVGGPATGLADIDGDGDLDGTCCGGGGPSPATNTMPSKFHLSINDGTGRFAPAWTIPSLGAFRFAGAVDVDRDGDRDLVAGRSVFYNRSDFRVDSQPTASTLIGNRALALGDLDRDGDVDSGGDWSFRLDNDGTGRLSMRSVVTPTPPTGTWFRINAFHGDFDGDGDVDMVARHESGTAFLGMRLFLNNGGGGYTDGGYAAPAGVSFSNDATVFGDMGMGTAVDGDRDGDQDLLVGNRSGLLAYRVWLSDGHGTFTMAQRVTAGSPVAVADLDRDGHLDVVSTAQVSIYVAYGRGNGQFDVVNRLIDFVDYDDRVAVADLDTDGWLDIAMIDRALRGELVVEWGLGARTFSRAPLGSFDASFEPCQVGALDADGDGRLDLLVHPGDWHNGDCTAVLYGDGARLFPRSTSQTFEFLGLADLDGDGDLDAVGPKTVRNAQALVPQDGYRAQFGSATAGLGGMAPCLGAVGPFHAGGAMEYRLTGGPGGSLAAVAFGLGESSLPNWPFPGLTAYAAPFLFAVTVPLGGEAGLAGAGYVRVPLTAPAEIAGATLWHQAYVLDAAAPFLLTQSNGLRLSFR